MMDRRTFTFATLLGIGTAATAHAGARPQAASSAELRATWAVKRKGSQLLASLTLHNDGTEPVDVAVTRGSQPGAWVVARVDGEEVTRVLTDLERRDVMTRIGPMPKYEPVLAGRSREIGTYTYQLSDPDSAEVELEVIVDTGMDVVNLPTQRIPIDGKPAT
jgi:hypothetical protein